MKLANPVVLILAVSLALSAPAAFAVNYGFGFGASNGEKTFTTNNYNVQKIRSSEIGFLLDTSRQGRVFQDRLLLSLAQGKVDNFLATEPLYSGPRDIPEEIEYWGAMLSNSLRFVIAPGAGSTFWIGPTFYAGYFTFEDQDGKNQGNGTYFGIGPSLGVDARGSEGTLTLELAYRLGGQNVHEAQQDQYFDGIQAEETVFRIGWLFGD